MDWYQFSKYLKKKTHFFLNTLFFKVVREIFLNLPNYIPLLCTQEIHLIQRHLECKISGNEISLCREAFQI